MPESRSKLMIKNTIFLYMRMFVIMCLNLVAVRLLLKALGATDYGIFNVVGGVMAMLTFLSSSMSSAAQRFYAYSLGSNNDAELRKIFGVSITAFILIVLAMIILAETGGLWMVREKLTIPENRFFAANWVYQFSVVAFSVNMLCVPFIALVIASERMSFYAIVSVIDAVLKLAIILIIKESSFDKLIYYGGLYMSIAVVNFVVYLFFVYHRFRGIRILPMWDKKCFMHLFSYCSWYMFGSVAQVVRSQGINILLNIFFNPIVNTARGLAYQVNAAVNMFVTSFYQAVRPQIIKRHAANEIDSMKSLVINSTKMSYYLVLLISVPLLTMMPDILGLWLGDVPEYTVLFTRLVIITTMVETLGYPLSTAICADGKIKWFQIFTGSIILLNLPVSYVVLKLGFKPQSTMYVAIIIAVITHLARMWFYRRMFCLDFLSYGKMLLGMLFTTILSLIVPMIAANNIPYHNFSALLLIILLNLVWTLFVTFAIGFNKHERSFALSIIKSFSKR